MVTFVVWQLQDTAMDQASEVFKSNEDHELLTQLKTSGMNRESERVAELSVKFQEHSDQLQEVWKVSNGLALLIYFLKLKKSYIGISKWTILKSNYLIEKP